MNDTLFSGDSIGLKEKNKLLHSNKKFHSHFLKRFRFSAHTALLSLSTRAELLVRGKLVKTAT